jgi:hypothetical protein
MDSNPAWLPNVPFRFLDLPPEIREMIYPEIFLNQVLRLAHPHQSKVDRVYLTQDPSFDLDRDAPDGKNLCQRGDMPGILMASRLIRAEAIPVFFRGLCLYIEPARTSFITQVPSQYFDNAQIIEFHRPPRMKEIEDVPLSRLRKVYMTGSMLWLNPHHQLSDLLDDTSIELLMDELDENRTIPPDHWWRNLQRKSKSSCDVILTLYLFDDLSGYGDSVLVRTTTAEKGLLTDHSQTTIINFLDRQILYQAYHEDVHLLPWHADSKCMLEHDLQIAAEASETHLWKLF